MIVPREIVKIRSPLQNCTRVAATNGDISPDARCFKKMDIQPVSFFCRLSGATGIRLKLVVVDLSLLLVVSRISKAYNRIVFECTSYGKIKAQSWFRRVHWVSVIWFHWPLSLNKWSKHLEERPRRMSCCHWGLNHLFCCVHRSRDSQCFQWAGQPPEIAPSRRGDPDLMEYVRIISALAILHSVNDLTCVINRGIITIHGSLCPRKSVSNRISTGSVVTYIPPYVWHLSQ